MFNHKSKQIVEKLIDRPKYDINHLIHSLGMSKPQMEYSLEKLNQYLDEQGYPSIRNDGRTIQINHVTQKFFLTILSSEAVYDLYELNPVERKKYIFLKMVYYTGNYLSVNHFLDALKVKKTTFMNDMKQLEIDTHHEIAILYDRQQGYHLAHNEGAVRHRLIKMIIEDFADSENRFLFDYFLYYEEIDNKQKIESVLKECMETYDIHLVENRYRELVYMLIFLLPRLVNSWDEFYEHYNFQTLLSMEEYQFSRALLKQFDIHNPHAYLYLGGWVLGMSIGKYEDKQADFSIINELVQRIVQRFEALSGVRFKDRQQVIHQLYSHFRPAYYRLFFKFPIINVMNERIQTEYPDLFRIVEETLKPIEHLFDYSIPEEEVSFLTVHFASLIDNFDEYKIQRKVGIVVCPNGIGSSAIIYNELKSIFPEIILMGPIESSDLSKKAIAFDMIFTTVRNIDLFEFKKPIYVVTPIMSIDEKFALRNEVNGVSTRNYSSKEIEVLKEKLVKVTLKYIDPEKKGALDEELGRVLSNELGTSFPTEMNEITESAREIRLSSLLKQQYIQTNVDARQWEEAIYIAASPLLRDDIITRNYVDTIINNVYAEGPYMIIMDHVALPHARPRDGALRLGMSLTVLKTPIIVSNGKVMKYIFTLAAVDQKQHLSAISDLVSVLEKDDFLRFLDQECDPNRIHNWLKERSY